LDDRKLEIRIRKLGGLPRMPAVAAEIGRVAADPESSASDIARLVAADPAFSARLLRIVNSAFFSPSTPVTDIQSAVVLLGLNAVKAIAVALGLASAIPAGLGGSVFDRVRFLRHSLAVGFGARAAAQLASPADQEAGFLAGVLHDIGRPVLDAMDPRKFKRLVRAFEKTRLPMQEIERQILGFDHAELGCEAATAWGVPREISLAIGLHHTKNLPDGESGRLAECIRCGDAAARQMGLSFFETEKAPQDEWEPVQRELSLGPDAVGRIQEIISCRPSEIADLVSVFIAPAAAAESAA
jgi:putative nucleotidyltransferase with HDIG domain